MRSVPGWCRRWLLAALTFTVVAALGLFGAAPFASAATSTANTIVGNTITGPGGKCVDVRGDDDGVNGAPILLWDCQLDSADQHWTWSGTALITIGRCLDVTNVGTTNGSQLQLWDCTGGGNQQWVQQANGTIRNPQSGRCIDSPGGATATGTRLQIWDCNNTAAQTFTLTTGTSTNPGTCPTYSDNPDFGPNVHIYDHTMSDADIQSSLDTIFNAQKDTNSAQFSTRRDAEIFMPSTTAYNVGANIGFNTSILGVGQNPDDVRINGAVTVDAFNASDAGNATQNFWRSAENLSINTLGGIDRWAVAQAAPLRRIHVLGGLNLFPASYGWASGGYISDTKVDGNTESASQQQWYTKDSTLGSWSGSNWNMVFSGVNGAPATNFNTTAAGPRYTTLATTPVSRDVPYLYLDATGKYRVFLPSLRNNATGPSWSGGSTPGTSLPMNNFYVVHAGDSAATINAALANGCNLFFTPGIYHVNQTLHVTKANTTVLGIGYPTIVPDNGVNAMDVADVDGVRLKGLLFDAGTTNSDTLLTIGTARSGMSHASNPTTVQDVFFRIGGMVAGKATNSLIINNNDTIIDHMWAWRADHGSGIGWTVNTADNGLTVNGDNVLASGLFVEHYQKNEVTWNGTNGKIIFFQNEMPYDPPNQTAWMNGNQNGYPAIKVATNVTAFEAWGLGSYCFFNANPTITSQHSFEAPTSTGVKFHDMAVVSLGGVGTITNIINNTGSPTNSSNNNTYLVSYP